MCDFYFLNKLLFNVKLAKDLTILILQESSHADCWTAQHLSTYHSTSGPQPKHTHLIIYIYHNCLIYKEMLLM